MLRLHQLMFGQVYDWGGRYRSENLVVGRREFPTKEWELVPDATKTFFKKFSNPLLRQASKSKSHIVAALVEFHKELAWIHPFKDGNGRVIRTLSALLALEWNYVLFWDIDSSKKKHRYHYAIQRAVHTANKKYLRSIIEQSLSLR
jgi:cell filamentation protein